MQSVLILGAGLMQRPAIDAAHELGYRAVVADGNAGAPCAGLADTFVHIDLKDRNSLLSYAESMKDELSGVFTAGTDFSASVSFVAEKLGLPAHSFEAALNASDKIRMRSCFQKSGVPSPRFHEITGEQWASDFSPADLLSASGLSAYPLVIKPCDNMGGRGCSLIRSASDAVAAVHSAVSCSRSGRAILEEYMDGPEFSIDALVFNGEVTITGFADRHIFFPPYFIEMGHTMPTTIGKEDWTALVKAFVDGIHALGLSHGVAKADIKLTSRGPMIGEIAGRLSGGYMSGWTYPYASDVFLTKQALLLALGKQPADILEKRVPTDIAGVYDMPCLRTSAERAWLSIPGKAACVHNLEAAAGMPAVKQVLPRILAGDEVTFPVNNVGKCGNVITVAGTREEAVNAALAAVSAIVVELEKGNESTEAFLAEPYDTVFPPSAFVDDALFQAVSSLPEGSVITLSEEFIPSVLAPYADTIEDWNHRTIRHTLKQAFLLKGARCVDEKRLCRALVRGGIQGVLYILDDGVQK